MNTKNLSSLQIHKLSEEQYRRVVESEQYDENALYLTPDADEIYIINIKFSNETGRYYIPNINWDEIAAAMEQNRIFVCRENYYDKNGSAIGQAYWSIKEIYLSGRHMYLQKIEFDTLDFYEYWFDEAGVGEISTFGSGASIDYVHDVIPYVINTSNYHIPEENFDELAQAIYYKYTS